MRVGPPVQVGLCAGQDAVPVRPRGAGVPGHVRRHRHGLGRTLPSTRQCCAPQPS